MNSAAILNLLEQRVGGALQMADYHTIPVIYNGGLQQTDCDVLLNRLRVIVCEKDEKEIHQIN